jgi:acyl-CoA synthetase (AMP-forming)/AMP-acid ligase II
MTSGSMALPETALAGGTTVSELFLHRARLAPDSVALREKGRETTYGALRERVLRLATAFRDFGLEPGERIALLSENRGEYLEIQLAAGCLGLIVACQNWRQSTAELDHCIRLVSPALVITSARFQAAFAATRLDLPCWTIEDAYEKAIARAAPLANRPSISGEAGLIILYTSGTTGLPKGALISHRAEIARMAVGQMDLGITRDDGFIAWAPMFHMGSTDQMLATLMSGGIVHVVDGFQPREIVEVMRDYPLGWHLLMPGSIEPVVEILRAEQIQVKSIRIIGAMLDLVPRALAIDLATLSGTPYLNSFGSTETGLPPASARRMSPADLLGPISKWPNSMVDIRLVDSEGNEVPDGEPGEMAVRGPTLFSGYWNAPETNRKDFAGGRFRMGDMFMRNPDGSFDFVDRAKYMIKSGGENIYPAEIERVLLADPRIRDAVIVRKRDPRWGEIPVALIARQADDLDAAAVETLCRASLAGYKRPREVHFVAFEDLPRSTTGKIQRHEAEKMLEAKTMLVETRPAEKGTP